VTVALLVCPAAGLGAAGRVAGTVASRLREACGDVQLLVASDAEGTIRLAHKAVRDGAEVLAVLGGDGAAHAGVQACAGTETALAVIPAGTGNDFARALDLSLDGVVEALRSRGYDTVQICHFHLPTRDQRYLAELRSALDDATRTMAIEVELSNADHALRPGMYVRVQLAIERKAEALLLPAQFKNVAEKSDS